jgi:hypothetical protein
MDARDVMQVVILVGFWFACDWAASGSTRKKCTLLAMGFALLIVGTNNGFEAGKAKGDRDAQQAAILTDRNMPR